jgi:hypothetical protein
MKVFRMLVVIVMALLLVAAVQAQDTPITYGEPVTGEVTSRAFEVGYVFEGEAGDIVVITLRPDDAFEGLDEAALLLLNADGDVVANVEAIFANAVLAVELADSGSYTVIATRQNGRSGESEGPFTLTVDKLELLEVNETVNGTASETQSAVFAVRSETPVELRYLYSEGELEPQITVNVINNDFAFDDNLDEIVNLTGSQLRRVTVGIPETDTLYIISVGVSEFYFSFSDEEETVDFALTLLSAE